MPGDEPEKKITLLDGGFFVVCVSGDKVVTDTLSPASCERKSKKPFAHAPAEENKKRSAKSSAGMTLPINRRTY